MAISTSNHIVVLTQSRGSSWKAPDRLLCLDPGNTTGWALFIKGALATCGQVALNESSRVVAMKKLFNQTQPSHVVAEDYFIYGNKTKQHAWSRLFTPKLLGIIEALCHSAKAPLYLQSASQAKAFATDQRLRAWGLLQDGSNKHANDAIRHGIYCLFYEGGLQL